MTKKELPKHVYRKPSGAVYFYKRGQASIRLHAEPGTTAFMLEVARAMEGAPMVARGGRSFVALIRSYQKSTRWEKLAPRTQADYQKVLAWVEAKLGPLPVERMQRKDVIRAQMANKDAVRFANYIVQVLRILFEHSIDLGWRQDNPAKKVESLKADTEKREPWPADLVKAYRADKDAPLGSRQRAALELGIGTGQRPGDLVRMRWDDLRDGGIVVKQGKTGARLWIPLTKALRAALDATPRRGLTILAQENGKPTSYRGLAQMVLIIRKRIGAEDYDMHSWRYTAAAELAAAGCDDALIQSITGHKTGAMVAQYAGAARQKTRAIEAMKRREG